MAAAAAAAVNLSVSPPFVECGRWRSSFQTFHKLARRCDGFEDTRSASGGNGYRSAHGAGANVNCCGLLSQNESDDDDDDNAIRRRQMIECLFGVLWDCDVRVGGQRIASHHASLVSEFFSMMMSSKERGDE
jgi:hypothetical protein